MSTALLSASRISNPTPIPSQDHFVSTTRVSATTQNHFHLQRRRGATPSTTLGAPLQGHCWNVLLAVSTGVSTTSHHSGLLLSPSSKKALSFTIKSFTSFSRDALNG